MAYLGDDHPLEIVGRGGIKVNLDDGRQRKLCGVWHVTKSIVESSLNQDGE